MQAENLLLRQQKTRLFVYTFLLFLLLYGVFFYWGFKRVPEIYLKQQALSATQAAGFVKATTEADTIVWQIQAKPNVKQESVVAFYEWMNTLKTLHTRPLCQVVLDGYIKRVIDVEKTRQKDTLGLVLQKQYNQIKAETAALMSQNTQLKQELAERKAQINTLPKQ